MIPLTEGAHVHLIAACGTAMGSLAGLLRRQGYRVTGSDSHVYPPMSDFLRDAGIVVHSGFDPAHLEPAPDLVVVGNAVSRGNPELEAALDRRLPYAHLPEVLRDLFLAGRRPLVVTGTHGKTTTTALTAHLLRATGADPSWLVAGLPRDLPLPYHIGTGDWFVLEGDEYDSAYFAKVAKFLFYRPQVLVINNIEFDHADIYRDLDEIRRVFRQAVNQVPRNGLILANGDDPVVAGVVAEAPAPVQTFGAGAGCDWRFADARAEGQGQSFDWQGPDGGGGRVRLGLSGEYNRRNALAAIAAASFAGIDPADLVEPLAGFVGVRRRQESLGTAAGVLLVDDFAHHPTAVGQTLAGLRESWPDRRLWAVFEPASSTNARAVFEQDYVRAFEPADAVIVGAVPRPERARDDEPFSAQRLAERLSAGGVEALHIADPAAIARHLAEEAREGDVVVFMSNAGFGGVQRLTQDALEARAGG